MYKDVVESSPFAIRNTSALSLRDDFGLASMTLSKRDRRVVRKRVPESVSPPPPCRTLQTRFPRSFNVDVAKIKALHARPIERNVSSDESPEKEGAMSERTTSAQLWWW